MWCESILRRTRVTNWAMRLIMLKLLRPAVGYNYTCVSCVRRAASFQSTLRKEEHTEEETYLCRKDEWTGWEWERRMWSCLLKRAAWEYPAWWRWGSTSSIICGFAPFQNVCYTASESASLKSSKDNDSLLAQHLDALPPPPLDAICFFGTLQYHNLRIILQWLTKN